MVYILDRNTATRVGRPPSIADENVGTPMVQPGPGCPATFVAMLTFWGGIAGIQGRMVPRLFGPVAKTLSNDQRAAAAGAFVAELDVVFQHREQTNAALSLSLGSSAAGMLITGEKMLYLGTV